MKEREDKAVDFGQGAEAANNLLESYEAPEGPMEKEWMLEAEKMVDTFRETRNLFTAARVCGGNLFLGNRIFG